MAKTERKAQRVKMVAWVIRAFRDYKEIQAEMVQQGREENGDLKVIAEKTV
jgi:hypothetical protein